MTVNMRRDAWTDDRQFDDIRTLAYELGVITPIFKVYTPSLNNATNVSASTTGKAMAVRFKDFVIVSGILSVDPTGAGNTVLGVSLPFPSNFKAADDCSGVAFSNDSTAFGAGILANITNNEAAFQWVATDTANRTLHYIFMYRMFPT